MSLRTTSLSLFLGAALAVTAGCARADGDADAGIIERDTVIVHDGVTATIRIVENRGTGDVADWRLSAEPQVDVGGVNASEETSLFRVAGAFRLPDGRIVVADGGSTSLKLFGPSGEWLRAIGRPGEGPGEFRAVSWFGLLHGDSLVLWDFAQGRLTVFDTAGAVVREVRIGATPESPRSDVIGMFADGSLLSRDFVRLAGPPAGLMRHAVGSFHLSPSGALLDSVAPLPAGEAWFISRDGGFSAYTAPFARTTQIVAHGQAIFTGDTGGREIHVLTPGGELRRIIRWTAEVRRVNDADVEAARRDALGEDPTATTRSDVERMFAEVPVPGVMPALGLLRVDTEGDLWVQDYRTHWEEGDTRWTIFDPVGRRIARITLPGALQPTHIGRDFLLGVARDEFDVEHVRLFGLIR